MKNEIDSGDNESDGELKQEEYHSLLQEAESALNLFGIESDKEREKVQQGGLS